MKKTRLFVESISEDNEKDKNMNNPESADRSNDSEFYRVLGDNSTQTVSSKSEDDDDGEIEPRKRVFRN